MDNQGHAWYARSTMRGEVRLYDTEGHWVGSFASRSLFSWSPGSGAISLSLDGRALSPTIRGTGTHELSIEDGVKPAGYVQIVPYDSKSAITNFYSIKPLAFDDGDFFAPYDVLDTGISWSQPGLAGSVDRTSGVAWKLKGYASVDLQYYGVNRHVDKLARMPIDSVPLPPPLRDNQHVTEKTFQSKVSSQKEKPVLSYSIANKNLKYFRMPAGGFLFYKGRWVNPVQSGTFIGYGRHVVLDEQGKPLLSFDIQPLKPVATPTLRR